MKPSEFWARIFALPEQARHAESEAAELRNRADALTAWAKLAMAAHHDALFAADAEEMSRAVEIIGDLPACPDFGKVYGAPVALGNVASFVEKHGNVAQPRKLRSDAGKPRGRKTDESAPANPADVKAEDAARVKLAGQIRGLLEAERGSCEPFTIYAIQAVINASEDDIRGALKLLSLVSWRMQREGDSQPVQVWGTVEQFAHHVGRMTVKSGDRIADTVAKYQCSEFDARRVWTFLDPMRSS